jgi:hypothetical protein
MKHFYRTLFTFLLLFLSTINLSAQCNEIYVSTTGSGVGSKADPTSLSNAMSIVMPKDIIKLAAGIYNIDSPLFLSDSITIEGGFLPANNWEKTSLPGATTINRTTSSPEGATNSQRLVAIYGVSKTGFLIQDITITTANANQPGMSTYGLHLTACSNYSFVRTQVLPGNAAAGANGVSGLTGIQGGNGSNGSNGSCDGGSCAAGAAGGNGGLGGGGASGGNGGAAVSYAQNFGMPGTAAAGRNGGGGGGGGAGGDECSSNNGGNGGLGGGSACGSGGAAGPKGNDGDPGSDGGNGTNGGIGTSGSVGSAGAAGSHIGGFWVAGSIGGTGTDGCGGRGGGGGGGGGRQFCTFCNDGPGNGGSGGGGGGQGGTGGNGGRGGGSSFAIYLVSNGVSTNFLSCNFAAGSAGAGGSGGPGGPGGAGGAGGVRITYCTAEIGEGGKGGNGGAGGAGGAGGNGSTGTSVNLYLNGGTAPVSSDITFNLASLPVIKWNNQICALNQATFSSTSSGSWSLGAVAIPSVNTGLSMTTEYQVPGRFDVTYNGSVYKGFVYVSPYSVSNALAGSDQTLCIASGSIIGNVPSLGTGSWTALGSASIANPSLNSTAVSGLTVGNNLFVWTINNGSCCPEKKDTVNLIYNTPTLTALSQTSVTCLGGFNGAAAVNAAVGGTGPYSYDWAPGNPSGDGSTAITGLTTGNWTCTVLDANTCSSSYVFTIPTSTTPLPVGITGANQFCLGGSTILTGTGASSYTWNSGATTPAISVGPSINTSYTVTGTDAVSGCTNTAVQSITINPLPTVSIASSNTVICFGATSTLTAGGASSYTWNTSSNSVSISPSPTITTTYTVIGANATTGCSNTAIQSISVNPLPTIVISSTNPIICSGESSALNATGASSYTWSTNATTSVISVNPSATTNYSVVGMDAITGCSNSASTGISVNPTPTLSVTASGIMICIGETTTLTVNGASSYSWNSGGITNSISVNPISTTNYTVIGTDAITGCSNSAVQTISVNALPVISISASNSIICIGESALLTANGADTYSWSSNSTNNPISVSPLTNTSYTVIGTETLSGCTNTSVQNVLVNPLPVVTASASEVEVCSGTTVTLSGSGATNYVWTNGVINNTPFTPTLTNTYTVTGTDANGCNNTATQIISVNPLPTVTAVSSHSILCYPQVATITLTGANSYTLDQVMITGSNFTVSPATTTQYVVIGVNDKGCVNTSTISQKVSECTSIEEPIRLSSNVNVYPNPNEGSFTVGIKTFSEKTLVEIYNSLGQLIESKNIYSHETSIDISTHTKGVYTLRVIEEGKIITQHKLIKN